MTSDSSSSSDSDSDEEKDDPKKKGKKDAEAEVVVSDDDSDSESDEGSSSSEDKKKKKKDKKKKDKKKKDAKTSKKGKKGKKEKKGKKDKKDKKDKKGKSKKDKKKKKLKETIKKKKQLGELGSCSNQFGKYGILKAEDFFSKKAEFLVWAMEVKKANTDALGQMQQKDLFKEYVEDYNTATMPSQKYYNLQAWDTKQSYKRQKRAKNNEMDDAGKAALASFDDEAARREEIRHNQAKKQEQALQDEVRKMRGDKGKVEEMRHQSQLRQHMDQLNRSGQTEEAAKIAARLAPSTEKVRPEFGGFAPSR
jgi:hypothetical protein